MAPFVVPALIGAGIGAGVAEATGGKWEKGAMYGAVGGAMGGAINPYSVGGATQVVSASTVGGVAGGATGGYAAGGIAKMMKQPSLSSPQTSKLSPAPTTVMAAQRAEVDRGALLKRRRRASVMGGDYGQLNVQTQKLGT